MSDEIHKAVVQALVRAAPEGCTEVVLECLFEDDTLELTVIPEAAARALPESFTQVILNLSDSFSPERLRSARYAVALKDGEASFDASFAFFPVD